MKYEHDGKHEQTTVKIPKCENTIGQKMLYCYLENVLTTCLSDSLIKNSRVFRYEMKKLLSNEIQNQLNDYLHQLHSNQNLVFLSLILWDRKISETCPFQKEKVMHKLNTFTIMEKLILQLLWLLCHPTEIFGKICKQVLFFNQVTRQHAIMQQ